MKDEYPKQMHHPNFAPAVLSDDNAAGRFRDAPPGKPAQYPPVTVSNADQEEYHASRGYLPSNGKAHPPQPAPSRHKERENIRMRQDEEPEAPEFYEYPKWVGDKIAKNADEEAAILAAQEPADERPALTINTIGAIVGKVGEIDPAELAEFRAWKANPAEWEQFKNWKAKKNFEKRSEATAVLGKQRRSDARYPRHDPEQAELLMLCAEAGIKVDARYSVRRLREMLEAATAPQESADGENEDREGNARVQERIAP